jgi:pimeloyl-ACP methyl ester carboxylesterase
MDLVFIRFHLTPGSLEVPLKLINMKLRILLYLLIISHGLVFAQDTLFLRYPLSKGDTVIYKRIVLYDNNKRLYLVRDFYENGQIQMEASYSFFDKNFKEEYQCNYRTNTKEGGYKEWFKNGQLKFDATFKKGVRNGLCSEWYSNGQKQSQETWENGRLNGSTQYWSEAGELLYYFRFSEGENLEPKAVNYKYLTYLPERYYADSLQYWPLIIYLHGGSDRGSNLNKLYSSGIPDQIYRGRKFPFIVVSPQCPEHLRWETENWFEPLYREIVTKFRIDTNRIFLTGYSLGGAGTWYLAVKYPEIFAAIAPMTGFTSQNAFIDNHIHNLDNIPVWASHGKVDNVVPFEETERIVTKIGKENHQLKFTADPVAGHWIHWSVYPGQDIYDWFLMFSKNNK